jgi:hypothetical protein
MHYSVIANGLKVEVSFVSEKRKLTRYHEEVPIPAKVMWWELRDLPWRFRVE